MSKLADIPKVDKVLAWPEVDAFLAEYSRPLVIGGVRRVLAKLRSDLLAGVEGVELVRATVVDRVRAEVAAAEAPSLRRVVNGTGVVIHTNLGRAPLPAAVRELLGEVACGYSNLEFDLAQGERGDRHSHVEGLLCALTGAEAALVVNNNAAAVLLALSALASGREVVVSRGELVEIGGSFRVPDIMRQGGAILREIGTTNRTHPRDYSDAISPATALLLKVHTSNFAQIGFTREVTAAELAAIGREASVPVMIDAGSGCILDLGGVGLTEPTIPGYVRSGVDLVAFSGDKLLGGPQAGIIVGRKEHVGLLKRHPLQRALRLDKLGLAALEATLRLYRDERKAFAEIPVLRMLAATPAELAGRGRSLIRRLRRSLPAAVQLLLATADSQVGGGAMPLAKLPTTVIVIRMAGLLPQELERRLRSAPVPVIGRISRGDFLLDLRTIMETDLEPLVAALRALVV